MLHLGHDLCAISRFEPLLQREAFYDVSLVNMSCYKPRRAECMPRGIWRDAGRLRSR